ncbi:MAG: aspartate aminotransferase family protein [Candidatus Aenigmarchaeota archaeon]|nr:aspartate aminotransferase family protein [Candidatus Aenigmarchaeota archaeon]
MEKKIDLSKSLKLFHKEEKLMPGGVSSNARIWHAKFCPRNLPCTVFIKKANGSYIWDVDGNKYIDYRLGFGPVILGHSYPEVVQRLHHHEKEGSIFAFDNEMELSVSEKFIKAVPCAEMVRYSVTGTEATMHSLRLARAYTGKEKVMKFEGHYHGSHDYLLWSTAHMAMSGPETPHEMSLGIPKAIRDLIVVAEFNNFEDTEARIKKHAKDLAAVIVEPMMGNGGGITPAKGFLKFLRETCDKYGVVLIFDEVKTGFRLAYGGAQEVYKVKPHLATYAKSISNGYPLSAITGQEEIMRLFGRGAKMVTHGGTYASNPISMMAADATLDVLRRPATFKHLNHFGKAMIKGMDRAFAENRLDYPIIGEPTMFNFGCAPLGREPRYREFRKTCDMGMFANIQYELMKEGVMIDEDVEECIYTCLSHGKEELRKTLDAFHAAVPRAKKMRTKFKPSANTSSA